jgi:hypothetical protein
LRTLLTLTSFFRLNLTLSNKAYNTKRKSIKMETDTKVMSTNMASQKDLEYLLQNVVIYKQENGIWINYMGLPSVHIQVVTVIGGNIRMVRRKDMDHTGEMDRDARGNSSRIRVTGMEYADGQMDQYIMGNTNRERKMVMAIIGIHLAMNTTESSRMTRDGEMES